VTFHEFAPNLARALVTLDYHPQGFSEPTPTRQKGKFAGGVPLRAMPWSTIDAKPSNGAHDREDFIPDVNNSSYRY
jgi:hypothetical protein